MSRKWLPSQWQRPDWFAFAVTVITAVAIGFFYWLTGVQQTSVAEKQTQLNAWTEGVKELKSLYPALLYASAGHRPLVSQPNFKQFDDLRLKCKPFVSEPSQRIHFYLVQMAASARFMGDSWSAVQNMYETCWPLAEQLANLELRYPPTPEESLVALVRRYRDYLAPNDSVAELTGLTQTGDSALALYVGNDPGLLAVIRSAVRRPHVTHSPNLRDVDLRGYNLVVVDGGVDSLDIGRLSALVRRGCGLVLTGQTPNLLAGGNCYLGPIEDWFGADFILRVWGSCVTPAAGRILDRKADVCTDLPGPPTWGGEFSVLSPAGLGPRTVVLGWCYEDIGVFSAAVLPDSAHPGRVYYQGGLGEHRYPEFESLFVSGIRWAAGLLKQAR